MESVLLAVDTVYALIFLVAAVLAALQSNRDLAIAKQLVGLGAVIMAARWAAWAVTTETAWPNRAVVGAILGAALFTLVPAALHWIDERSKGAEVTIPTPAPVPAASPGPQAEKEIAQLPNKPVIEIVSPVAPTVETRGPQQPIKAQSEPSPAPSNDKGKEDIRAGEFELATHEALRNRAYDMADEILAFWRVYDEKASSIRSEYYGVEKDEKLLRLDNEASEKFKEQFSAKYNVLQQDIKKITKSDKWRMIFDNSMIGVDAIFSSYVKLKEMAKELQ